MARSPRRRDALIEQGRPWENGCIELFNDKQSDELDNRETFTTLVKPRKLACPLGEGIESVAAILLIALRTTNS